MTYFLTWEWFRIYLATGLVLLYLLRMLNMWLTRSRSGKHWRAELLSTFMPKKAID